MNPTCIYCGSAGPFDPEHALPQSLGKFKGLPELTDRVCKKCNNDIGGGPERQFARASPQAVFRAILGIGGNRKNEKINPFMKGSSGGRAIDLEATDPNTGIPLLFAIEDMQAKPQLVALEQLVVMDAAGKKIHIRLTPDISTEETLLAVVRTCVDQNKLQRPVNVAISTDRAGMRELFDEVGRKHAQRTDWRPDELNQPYTVTEAAMRTVGNVSYFRAIAKAAFHYFLAVTPSVRGDEGSFSSLRNFIRNGGKNEFVGFDQTGDRQLPVSALSRAGSRHVFVTIWQDGTVQVSVEYFLSFNHNADIFRVNLGTNVPGFSGAGSRGHVFAYYPDGPRNGREGEMIKLEHAPDGAILIPGLPLR